MFSCNTHHTIEEEIGGESKRADVKGSDKAAGEEEKKEAKATEAEDDEKIEGRGGKREGTDIH